MDDQTESSGTPETFSIIMYSAPTLLSFCELHAYTFGTGILQTVRIWDTVSKVRIACANFWCRGRVVGEGGETYKFHGGNLAGGGEVRATSIRIRKLRNGMFAVVHCEHKSFAIHS